MSYPITRIIIIAFLLIYALFLLSLFDSERLFRGKAQMAFLSGALMFVFVFLVQNPMQTFVGNSGRFSGANYLIGISVLALIAGFLQELLKIVPVFAIGRGDFFIGAASGAGFGFIEAMIMLVPTRTLAVTEIAEWLIVLAFQIALTAIFTKGMSKGKTVATYLTVSVIHSVLEFFIILGRMKPELLTHVDIVTGIATAILFLIALKTKQEKPV